MANTDTPKGLVPIKHRNGAPYNGAANPYYKPAGYATALFVGDVVVKTGTANTAAASAPGLGDFNIATLPEINKTTAGDSNTDGERQTGVVVGFGADPDNLTNVYSSASTEAIVWVVDDPSVVFEVQCPSAIAATQIGLNAVLIDTHSGSTVTGLSGTEMDGGDTTAPAANASYQLLILRAVNRTDNETNAVHNMIEVVLNNHTEGTGMNTNAIGTLGI
tara:strand:+ start:8350 stop:9006 length:657 start_codon:yes stop_codon:yes gene_type:complete